MSIIHPHDTEPELLSTARRLVNALKQPLVPVRRQSLQQLHNLVTQRAMSAALLEQLTHMALKELIKCYYDHSEAMREGAVRLTVELLIRCENVRPFLPYVLEALKDRTNCVDLEGIDRLPEKLRPQPGQKPKIMLKLMETCEEIRLAYCELVKKIITVLEHDKNEMARHLDDMVNVLRALIMDPAPEVQKLACEVLKIFCDEHKSILLHFTEVMGRAVLLPLISKKSKIRVAGLNALTSVLWCGLWKYNAFVFENLIGFRDPNSVPIKDFYQPSNNINYLATFIIDPNVRVRQQFMAHLKVWICDLNDKYDHHGKLVPYLLSGLFDADQKVYSTAIAAIEEIGRQVEEEKEKEFRENKQFAIDAAWTWEGKLVGLPIEAPLTKRPSLGSRYFIRGHVRRFWQALYKQIRDINEENRLRSAKLALYGAIFTENYLTQFLDVMIPQLLPSILPSSLTEARVSVLICRIFFYIGRYCEQSAYIHLMKSCLEGKLIQNEEFVKCAMKGLAMMIRGNLEAVPEGQTLSHKTQNIIQLLDVLQECEIAGDVYNFNCVEAREIAEEIMKGIVGKGSEEQQSEIFEKHFMTLVKLISVSYYEEFYSKGYTIKNSEQDHLDTNQVFKNYLRSLDCIQAAYPSGLQQLQQYLGNVFCNPPSLMDSDWKLLAIFYRYLCLKQEQKYVNLFLLVQDAICECLSANKSTDLLTFAVKFIGNLIETLPKQYKESNLHLSNKLLQRCLRNLSEFKPMKKVPVYDQHLVREEQPNVLKTSEENYFCLFSHCSKALAAYYLHDIRLSPAGLAELIHQYLGSFARVHRNKQSETDAIRTIWAIFEKLHCNEEIAQSLCFKQQEQNLFAIPEVVDFCVARLEAYTDAKMSGFVFGILTNIVKGWPAMKRVTDKYPHIYSDFPELLEKLFKYTLNEKDIDTRQKYIEFLERLAKKMPDWFRYELNRAEQQKRYEKARLIKQIIHNAGL